MAMAMMDEDRADQHDQQRPLSSCDATAPLAGALTSAGLPKSGEDAGAMQLFVQQHLVSLLKPINEHVKDLQTQVRGLSVDVLKKTAMIDRNRERADEVARQLGSLKDSMKETQQKVDNALLEVSKPFELMLTAFRAQMSDEVRRLHEVLDPLPAKFSTMDANQQLLQSQVARLQNKLEENVARCVALENSSKSVEVRLTDMKHCHLGLSKRLEDTRLLANETNEVVGKLEGIVTHQGEEAKVGLARAKQRSQALDAKVERYSTDVRLVGDSQQRLREQVEELLKQFGAVESSLAEAGTLAADGVAGSDRVERDLEQLGTCFKDWQGALASVMNRVDANSEEIQKMEKHLGETTTQRLNDLAAASATHDAGIAALQDDVKNLEGGTADLASRLASAESRADQESNARKALEGRVETLNGEVAELATFPGKAEAKFEGLTNDVNSLSTQLEQQNEALGNNETDIKNMKGQMDALEQAIARESGRLDVAHEYIHGVGKGLQDAHKRTETGEDGFLPRKPGSPGPVLPDIPQSKRLANGALQSARLGSS